MIWRLTFSSRFSSCTTSYLSWYTAQPMHDASTSHTRKTRGISGDSLGRPLAGGPRRRRGALGGAQARRARARVGGELGVAGLDRAALQQPEGRRPPRADGEVARAARGLGGALAQEILHAAVFERVEGDHGEPAARCEQAFGRREAAIELAELVVDHQAQRLEGPRR